MRKWAHIVAIGMTIGACTAPDNVDTSVTTMRRSLSPPAAVRGTIRVVIEDPPSDFPTTLEARAQCENGPFQGEDAGTIVAGDVGNKYRLAVDAVDPEPNPDVTVPVPPGAAILSPRNHPTRWLGNAGFAPAIRSTTHEGWRGTMIVTYEFKKGRFPSGERVQPSTGARMAFSWWCTEVVPREPA
jgi:hypothetical protein